MKKLLFLLTVAVGLLTCCEGPPGRDGRDAEGMYWYVNDYTINSNQWQLVNGVDQLGSYFQAEIRISQLTREIYENGNVFCYMYQNISGVQVQTLLPFSVPYGRDEGNYEHLWTETYACDFSPGSIMFYVNYSDFYTNNRPPTTSFRVVLNY